MAHVLCPQSEIMLYVSDSQDNSNMEEWVHPHGSYHDIRWLLPMCHLHGRQILVFKTFLLGLWPWGNLLPCLTALPLEPTRKLHLIFRAYPPRETSWLLSSSLT